MRDPADNMENLHINLHIRNKRNGQAFIQLINDKDMSDDEVVEFCLRTQLEIPMQIKAIKKR